MHVDSCSHESEVLSALIQKEKELNLVIELTWQSVNAVELSALCAERAKHGCLTAESEAWIRATVRSRDQGFLDAKYVELAHVKTRIAALTN